MRRTSFALSLVAIGTLACSGGDTASDTAAATTSDTAAPTATAGAAGDADRSVGTGGGIALEGWKGKVDAKAAGAGKTVNDSRVAMDGANIAMKIGPAAVYWNPANTASGNYEVKASFTERAHKPDHPHSYGVFIGGADLDADAQSLAYCIVYADGTYSVKYFHGADKVETVADRQAHAAIKKADAAGTATNEVGWRVSGDKAACVINGTEVKSWPKSQLVGADKLKSTDGVYGVRVSHNIDVMMTPLVMTKM